jgi:predicted ATPase
MEALTVLRPLRQEAEIASSLRQLGHVYAASGESRAREARRAYGEALQLAIKHQLAPIALSVFVGAAQFYVRADRVQRALELLTLAARHPAATHETQEMARRSLAELTGTSASAQRITTQSQGAEWQSLALWLIDDLATPSWEQQIAILHNLLPQTTPFVGRVHELSEVLRCLFTPACRLLTLVGPGGIGKTRLALQAAQMIVDDAYPQPEKGASSKRAFADGVYFVPLQVVDVAGSLISAIAEATGFHFYSDLPPRQQLVNFLREKEMLLILDSMEHLPEGASVVSDLLTKTPAIKMLVTSQRSLNLHEEWFHPLAGMTLPRLNTRSFHAIPSRNREPKDAEANELQADAVQFFLQCAQRARVDFSLETEEEEVKRICRLVDGMPLALELAAAWLKVLSCKQIADEIERSLDILTARHHNIPANHRSMHTVLEESWRQLLDETEQQVLKRLSVIRGSFTQEAAMKIADASMLTLATLVEKALVRVTPGGRYQLHELLRQFAHRQLLANQEEERAIKSRHSHYYLAYLTMREGMLVGKSRRLLLDEMGQEIENVRVGWEWAVQSHNLDLLSQAVEPLYHFYQIQSRYQDGKELFSQAWKTLQQPATLEDARLPIVSLRVLARAAAFCHSLCEYDLAGQYLQEALAHAVRLDQRAEVAFSLNFLGQLAVWQGEQERAKHYLLQSLAISRQLEDRSAMASALDKLANFTHATFGEYAESKELATQSLALSRELGRPDWIAYALDTLGFITFCLGEYDEAASYYQESLTLFESIDDQYGMAMALGGMGLVLWAIGGERSVEAIAYFQKSLNICRTIGHQGQVVGRLGGLARVFNDLGDYKQAQALASEGLTIARDLGSPVYLSHLLYCLGVSAAGMGDLPAARRYLLEALHVTSKTGLLAYITIILFHYATLLIKEAEQESKGNPTELVQKQAQALELLAQVQQHPATWHLYKVRARQLYAELETRLPQEVIVVANARSERQTLAAVVAMLSNGEAEAISPASG